MKNRDEWISYHKSDKKPDYIPAGPARVYKEEWINWGDWLQNKPVKQATKFIRWIQLEDPLHIRIDGSSGGGVILKPQFKIEKIMDEEESSGI